MKRIVTATAFCLFAPSAMAAGASFFDGFDRLDTSRWYVSDGWANGAYQNCAWASDQIKIADGMLSVGFTKAAGAQGRAYRCGEIQTNATFSYGTYEARLKTPAAASGLNAAFFTYIGPQQGKPHDEIDFEVLLKDPGKVQLAGYVSGESPDALVIDLPAGQTPDFVHFAVVWSADKLDYYVDGELRFTIAAPTPIQSEEQKIFFSLWGSERFTEWMGPFADPGRPLAMLVDWVAYTAPGEACLFPQSISC